MRAGSSPVIRTKKKRQFSTEDCRFFLFSSLFSFRSSLFSQIVVSREKIREKSEEKQYTLWKFFIDEKHQHKGYGRQALQLAVNYLHNNFDCEEIYTGVYIGNNIAKHLYISFGFEETGKIEANMEELKYTFA